MLYASCLLHYLLFIALSEIDTMVEITLNGIDIQNVMDHSQGT